MPDNTPNPMYLFTRLETELLVQSYVPADYRRRHGIEILNIALRCSNVLERDFVTRKLSALPEETEKIILRGIIPTTLKVRHHIHEDGGMEEQPKRKDGPLRTYFDGSHIAQLSHAIAVCIDRNAGTITAQCPKGYDLNPKATATLDKLFPDYGHETYRHRQQEDQHSCGPLTLRNIFAFAGVMEPVAKVDILSWRADLLGGLREYERFARQEPDSGLAAEFNEQKKFMHETWGDDVPVFCRKYASPASWI